MVENKETQPAKNETSSVNFEQLYEEEKKHSEEYLTRLKYLQADFENLKKRTEREAEQIKKHCTECLIIELLDVVEELELALKTGKSSQSTQKSLLEGIEMTLKKLRKVLEEKGISPIDCSEGKKFDPQLHNAITAEERDDLETNTILEEIRRGYKMNDKVIRPSIVKVTVKKSK